MPSIPTNPGNGLRQQHAAQLRTQAEAAQQSSAQTQSPEPSAQQEAEQQYQDAGPVGQGDYVVKQGDCIASIAYDVGHFWETIWNDPANEPLREARQDGFVLLPGDRVTIPEKRRKLEPGETEVRHRFVRKGSPEKLVVYFEVNDEPRANEAYVLTIDDRDWEDTTGPDGRVEIPILPNAKRGKIVFVESGDEYELNLGHLDPITTASGVQGRLHNLGYYDGPIDGRQSPLLEQAVRSFQEHHNLIATGALDEAGQELLEQEHGS